MQEAEFFLLATNSLFVVLFLAWCYFFKDEKEFKKYTTTLFWTIVVVVVLKYTFATGRMASAFVLETTPSFPSMHSALVFSAAVFVAQVRKNWTVFVLGYALLVVYSRVYLGAHTWLDVLVGASIGSIIAFKIVKNKAK